MKNRLAWVALGVGAYVAFLISTFPAQAALRWFAPAQLAVSRPSGTIWSGSAAAVGISGFAGREIGWTIDLAPLLIGRVSGNFNARLPDGFVSTAFSASFGPGIAFRNLRLTTSLQALRDVLPVYEAEGQISASIDELIIVDGGPFRATGEVRLGNLAIPSPIRNQAESRLPVGDFLATLVESDEPGAYAQLADTGGPVELRGRVQLRPDRSYVFEARLRARDGAPPELVRGIQLMTDAPAEDGLRPLPPIRGTL